MANFACLTTEEKAEFRARLERYLSKLERELFDCDWSNTGLRRYLRMRRAHMKVMIKSLKEAKA